MHAEPTFYMFGFRFHQGKWHLWSFSKFNLPDPDPDSETTLVLDELKESGKFPTPRGFVGLQGYLIRNLDKRCPAHTR